MLWLLIFERFFVTTSDSNSSICTFEKPCNISYAFTQPHGSSSELVVVDNVINSSIFESFVSFCSQNSIRMTGMNQTIRDTVTLEIKHNTIISNFTFQNSHNTGFIANSSDLKLINVTFSRCHNFSLKATKSKLLLHRCVFSSLTVKSRPLMELTDSILSTENVSFDAISHMPHSKVPILSYKSSNITGLHGKVENAFQNPTFAQLVNSSASFTNLIAAKNSGRSLFTLIERSSISFLSSSFERNSCSVLNGTNSRFSFRNSSLQGNCISLPVLESSNCHLDIENSTISEISCGEFIKASSSSLRISNTNWTKCISPYSFIVLNESSATVLTSAFTNISAVNGSTLAALKSHLVFRFSKFEFCNSRRSGASIRTESSSLEFSSGVISNSVSEIGSGGLCLINSSETTVTQSAFYNNSFSITVLGDPFKITDTVFTGRIENEISVPLFDHCDNCTFAESPRPEVSVYHSQTRRSMQIIPIIIVSVGVIGALLYSRLRRSFRNKRDL